MTTETLPHGHLALDRWVWTHLTDGQPLGLITGYADDRGGIVAEQIVCWSGSLRAMLRAGLDAAWERGYAHVLLMIPLTTLRGHRLARLARQMEFVEYQRETDHAWFVRYRPC